MLTVDHPAKPLVLTLPWGPSTNTFLRHFVLKGHKHASTCISEDGRDYFREVGHLLLAKKAAKIAGPIAMTIELWPPDRRSIDVDNRAKPILDALKRRPKDKDQLPGAWIFADDDSQVVDLRIVLRAVIPAGKAVVTLTPLGRHWRVALKNLFDESEEDCPLPG